MVLAMTRPIRHPTTGIFWFRKGVPKRLRLPLGKSEEKLSLRTRDPAEAKIAHALISAEVEARWRQLSEGPQSLSHRQIESISGEIYREMIEIHGDNPDRMPGAASRLLLDQAFLRPKSARISLAGSDPEKSRALLNHLKAARNSKAIDQWLGRNGLVLELESREKLGAAVDRAVLQAREQLDRMSKGDYRPDPAGDRFPPLDFPGSKRKAPGKASPLVIFDKYAMESEIKPRTIKRWRPIFAEIETEVPDMAEMTREWVISWKDNLVARGLSNRTVREVYLAALKAACRWAVINNKIPSNPASEVTLRVRKAATLREKGFTANEAKRILTASLEPQPSGLSAHYRAARRWEPWLCAYTGARIGEIGQLRREDVYERDEIPGVRITPEAGTVKTDVARWVALHPTLIQQGFVDWFRSRPSGPLFVDMRLHRQGATPPAERVGQHLSKWVRDDIGIDDERVSPNHGWRHRFKTLSRSYSLIKEEVDYIQGHSPATAGDDYGDHPANVLLCEIEKLPDLLPSIRPE